MQIFVPSVEQETFTLKKKEFPELWRAEIYLIHSLVDSFAYKLSNTGRRNQCQTANCIHVQGGFRSCKLGSGAEQTVALSNEY